MEAFKVPVTVSPRSGMEIESAQNVVDNLWPFTKQIVETDGFHTPMLMVFTDKVMQIFNCQDLMKEGRKDILVGLMKKAAANPTTEAIVFVCEEWVVEPKDDMEALQVSKEARVDGLEKYPGRKESILMHVELRSGSKAYRRAEMIREGETVRLADPVDDEVNSPDMKMSGRFCNFFSA